MIRTLFILAIVIAALSASAQPFLHEQPVSDGTDRRVYSTIQTHIGDSYANTWNVGSAKKLTGKMEGFSDAKKTAEQIDKTVEEEKEDKKLDERILRLMYLVDGVRVSGSGGISVDHFFAKKFAVKKSISGTDFGVAESVVWDKMKRNIDKTPANWDDMGPGVISDIEKVLRKTETAIVEGERLKSDYVASEHSDMADRVIAGLSSLDGNKRVLERTLEILRDDHSTSDHYGVGDA